MSGGAFTPLSDSRSRKVGNLIASILQSKVLGTPALFVLNPVSNFLGLTIGSSFS